MSVTSMPSEFLRNVMQNGMGRYVCQLKRVTFRFCKSNSSSRHMRDFIENHLLEFTQKTPGVVCYLQPRRNRLPSLVLEYLNGRREVFMLVKKEPHEICQWVEHHRTRSGVQFVNMIKEWHTDTPSTQGIWHPFMFRDTQLAVTKFPDVDLSEVKVCGKSATDYVLEEQRQLLESMSVSGRKIEDK